MTLTSLASKHNIDHESAKAFLREWLDMQRVRGYLNRHGSFVDADTEYLFRRHITLIARPTDLGE
jgi:hypothetical protein